MSLPPSWRLTVIAAAAPLAGCYDLIASHEPVRMEVVDPRPNFIDSALAHGYSNRYTIADAQVPRFGSRIPVWLIADEANRRVSDDGSDRVMAHLRAQGCEPLSERSCAYRKVLRKLVEREESERRLVTLHFTVSPDAVKGCMTCVGVRLEIGERVGRRD